MRLSVEPEDDGYSPNANNYSAFLDGEKINYCITADEEEGYIKKFKEDEDHIAVDEWGNPLTEEIEGNVEIRKDDV